MNDLLYKLIYRSLLKREARRSIVGRNRALKNAERGKFDRGDVNVVLVNLWRHYDKLSPDIPKEPTVGARHNVRFACMTLAFYTALLEAGIEEDDAKVLINDTLWRLYKKAAFLPRLIARILTSDLKRRLRICVKTFMFFPFSEPGYKFEIVADNSSENAIAVKWTRCPKIDYLRRQGAEELCLACLCNLDYPLLEYWGGRFDRPCVQAVEHAHYCHMRFNIREEGARDDGIGQDETR